MGMSMVIQRVGMCTAVGLNAPAACAAMRVGITGFQETAFSFDGEWLQGAEAPLEKPWRGREKLMRLAEAAVRECSADRSSAELRQVPLIVNLAEPERPGRITALDRGFLNELIDRLGGSFHSDSQLLQNGRVGGVQAFDVAAKLFELGRTACIVVGVDSLLGSTSLSAYHQQRRLLTPANSDGFVPGEAAGALWLEPAAESGESHLTIHGWGYGQEEANILSELPLKGLGLARAMSDAISSGGFGFEALDYRICDANGEQYVFKEAALALARILRVHKGFFDIWHTADCIGEVGAATVPCALAVAWVAADKDYAPGAGVIAHFGNDDGQRAAVILRHEHEERSAA